MSRKPERSPRHPHICQIYNVGPDFLVLEYIDGKAVDWSEKIIDQRDLSAVTFQRTWARGALRASPFWPALAKRMNLPESAW